MTYDHQALKAVLNQVKGKVYEDYNIGKLTFFKTGGNAEYLYLPESIIDLKNFLDNVPDNVPLFVLGLGSNLLVRDGGVKGVVIKLSNFLNTEVKGETIKAEAGVSDKALANLARNNNLSGLEFLYTIPGSIGGALYMNAGAYGSEIKNVFITGTAVTLKGKLITLKQGQTITFNYRNSQTSEPLIFLDATFKCSFKKLTEISKVMEQMEQSRAQTQPINIKTAGSTFANPKGYKAWELVEAVGGKEININGAKISSKHGNFIENEGTASAKDIEDLGNLIKERVFAQYGIKLEWEIQIIGENKNV